MLEAILGINAKPFKTGLEEAKENAKSVKNELATMFVGAVGLGGAAEGISQAVEYAAHVGNIAEQYRVSAESVQKFGKVAEQEGSSLEGTAKAFGKLNVARENALRGNAEMIEHFKNLGVTLEDLKSMSADEIMLKIGAGSMEAADLVKVLGKSGQELIPTLQKLADGTAQFGEALDDLTVKNLKASEDRIIRWKQSVTNFFAEGIGAGIGLTDKLFSTGDAGLEDADRHHRDVITEMMQRELALRKAGKSGEADFVKEERFKFSDQYFPKEKERKPAEEEDEKRTNADASLKEKLEAIDSEAADKKLSKERELQQVRSEQFVLWQKLQETVADDKRKDLEEQILSKHREELAVQQQISASNRKDVEEWNKLTAKNKTAVEKSQFDSMTPIEKQADVLKRLRDLDSKLRSGDMEYTSPYALAGNLDKRDNLIKQLQSLNLENIRAEQPQFDDLHKHGGGYAGVNYGYRNSPADQTELLKQLVVNTAEFLNKNFKITIPLSQFGGGGTPGGTD